MGKSISILGVVAFLTLCGYSSNSEAARRHGGEMALSGPDIANPPPRPPVQDEQSARPDAQTTSPNSPQNERAAALDRPKPASSDYSPPKWAEWVVNTVLRAVQATYFRTMSMLGFHNKDQTEEQRRASFARAMGLIFLFFVLAAVGIVGFFFYRHEKTRKQIAAASKARLEKELAPAATVELDSKAVVFDPLNRAFRVVLVEKSDQKIALIEISDLKAKKIVEIKELAPGAVLLAQYLPANKQMDIGVLNGLEQIKYLNGWAFEKTTDEVRIYVREYTEAGTAPASDTAAAPPVPPVPPTAPVVAPPLSPPIQLATPPPVAPPIPHPPVTTGAADERTQISDLPPDPEKKTA